jgi:DNA-binding beta-propeller fold protein YncE
VVSINVSLLVHALRLVVSAPCLAENAGSCHDCGFEVDKSLCMTNYAILRGLGIVRANQKLTPNEDIAIYLDLPYPPGSQTDASTVQTCEICEACPAQFYCGECPKLNSLCHDCFQLRHKKAPMDSHAATPWKPSITNVRLCPEHNQECVMYCKSDNVVLCNLCGLGSHRGHDLHLIAEEVGPCMSRIKHAVGSLEGSGKSLQRVCGSVDDTYKALTGRSLNNDNDDASPNSVGAVTKNIHDFFSAIHECLRLREAELMQTVQDIELRKTSALEEQMDELALQLARNYVVASNVKDKLDPKAKCWLLENERDIMSYVHSQIQREIAMATTPATASGLKFSTKPEGLSSWERAIAVLGHVDEVAAEAPPAVPSDRKSRKQASQEASLSCDIAAAAQLARSSISGSDADLATASDNCRIAFNGDSSGANYAEAVSRRMETIGFPPDVVDEETYGKMPASGGEFIGTIGAYGKGQGQLQNPRGMCVCDGYLYVAEPGNNRIQVLEMDGKFVCYFGSESGVESPTGVFAANLVGQPLLFVLEADNHHLQLLQQDGSYVGTIGKQGSGPGELQKPSYMTCDGRNIYIADSNNNRISVFKIDGTFVRTMGSQGHGNCQFSYPSGICIGKGKVFVTDLANHRVVIMSLEGTFVGTVGSKGSGEGQLSNPTDICCYNGVLYITDSGNHRVQVFSCDGDYLGSFGSVGQGEGQLSYPLGICCYDDVLYVADSGNHRIQLFSLE